MVLEVWLQLVTHWLSGLDITNFLQSSGAYNNASLYLPFEEPLCRFTVGSLPWEGICVWYILLGSSIQSYFFYSHLASKIAWSVFCFYLWLNVIHSWMWKIFLVCFNCTVVSWAFDVLPEDFLSSVKGQ